MCYLCSGVCYTGGKLGSPIAPNTLQTTSAFLRIENYHRRCSSLRSNSGDCSEYLHRPTKAHPHSTRRYPHPSRNVSVSICSRMDSIVRFDLSWHGFFQADPEEGLAKPNTRSSIECANLSARSRAAVQRCCLETERIENGLTHDVPAKHSRPGRTQRAPLLHVSCVPTHHIGTVCPIASSTALTAFR